VQVELCTEIIESQLMMMETKCKHHFNSQPIYRYKNHFAIHLKIWL